MPQALSMLATARVVPARARRGDIRVGHVAHGLAAELRERGLAYACERHVRVGEHRGLCAQCVERTVRGVMG